MATHSKRDHFVGVELGYDSIRAAVYSRSLIKLGKAKRSTKVARGAGAVLQRVARCVADAVDEADLDLRSVCAVGIAWHGHLDPEGIVRAPSFGWDRVPLGPFVSGALGLPVTVIEHFDARLLAALCCELPIAGARVAGVFWDTHLGASLFDGTDPATDEQRNRVDALVEAHQHRWNEILPTEFRRCSGRVLRKALKNGDPRTEEFIRVAVLEAAALAADVFQSVSPHRLVFGGAVMADQQAELLPQLQSVITAAQPPGADWLQRLVVSQLDDAAPLLGAAMAASPPAAAKIVCPATSELQPAGFG